MEISVLRDLLAVGSCVPVSYTRRRQIHLYRYACLASRSVTQEMASVAEMVPVEIVETIDTNLAAVQKHLLQITVSSVYKHLVYVYLLLCLCGLGERASSANE